MHELSTRAMRCGDCFAALFDTIDISGEIKWQSDSNLQPRNSLMTYLIIFTNELTLLN